MSHVKVTLIAGIALVLLVGALVLRGSPPRVLRTSGPAARSSLGVTQSELTVCQGNEVLPAGATAVRVSIVAFLGSNMQVAALHQGRLLTTGSHNPDWSGSTVTVPIKPLDHSTSNVVVCVAFAPNSELLQLFGTPASSRNSAIFFKGNAIATSRAQWQANGTLRGRLSLAYLGPGHRSWWSQATSVATRMGFGHFIGGKSIALLAALLVAAMAFLTVRLTLREQP